MGTAARIVLLVLAGALASCATKSMPQPVDARDQELMSKDYFNSCMTAHGSGSQIGPTKSP
jgi:hypothetical protein